MLANLLIQKALVIMWDKTNMYVDLGGRGTCVIGKCPWKGGEVKMLLKRSI